MKVSRTRDIAAAPEDVWRVVADPYHLPRWWPRTERVEGVSGDGWTSVLGSSQGARTIRADYVLIESDPPRRRRWSQELAETPFERLFTLWEAEIELSRNGDTTRARLSVDSRGRGWARLGGFMVRRATARLLDEALLGLEDVVA